MLSQMRGEEDDHSEIMKKVGDMWNSMGEEERLKWRADGEAGSQVAGAVTFIPLKQRSKPSAYQMFVRHMTAQLKKSQPENMQSENMRQIGQLWRELPVEQRESYAPAAAQGKKGAGMRPATQVRTLSAHNLFVRAIHHQVKAQNPELAQGDCMKKVGEMWRAMGQEERNRCYLTERFD
jgi:hypothetical protein